MQHFDYNCSQDSRPIRVKTLREIWDLRIEINCENSTIKFKVYNYNNRSQIFGQKKPSTEENPAEQGELELSEKHGFKTFCALFISLKFKFLKHLASICILTLLPL